MGHMAKPRSGSVPVNMFDFETLMRETVRESVKLLEYFRLSLIYYQLVSGKGLEFDRIKEYYPGADPRRIDWKIFAKRGELKIRAFKEERHFDIIIVLDVSDTMLLGTTSMTKNEYSAIVAGALTFAAIEASDNVGLVMNSSNVSLAMDPSSDFAKIMSEVANKKNYGGEKDWYNLVLNLTGNYTEDSIVFVISDFIDTNPERFLPELAGYFTKVYGIMVRDPSDNEIPKGVGRMYLQDAGGKKMYLTDLDHVREEYAVLARRQIDAVRDAFHSYDQLFFEITTLGEFAEEFIKALGSEEVIVS
jgi:uncharacterized protein (DUF58 family)